MQTSWQAQRRRSSRSGSGGFTLVEVLVATVLLATGLVAAVGAFSATQRASARAQDLTTAALLAQQKLADIEAAPSREPGRSQGDFGQIAPDYTWAAEMRETRWEGVLQLQLEVVSAAGMRPRPYRVTTYLTQEPR